MLSKTPNRFILQVGLLLGGLCILLKYVGNTFDSISMNGYNVFSFILVLLLSTASLIAYRRRAQQHAFGFDQAFRMAFIPLLMAVCIRIGFTLLFLDPAKGEFDGGLTISSDDESFVKYEEFRVFFATTSLLSNAIFHALFSLVLAVILRRKGGDASPEEAG